MSAVLFVPDVFPADIGNGQPLIDYRLQCTGGQSCHELQVPMDLWNDLHLADLSSRGAKL